MQSKTGFAGNQSGLALVLTLLIISFLVVVTIELMVTVNRQMAGSAEQRERVRLDGLVFAGLSLGRAGLLADQQKQNKFDSTQDGWANLDARKIQQLAGDAQLKVEVSDLSGRLQVNALGDIAKKKYREVWLRFLLSGRFALAGEDQANALLDALGDWVDADDVERPQGAEEPYYRTLSPPYSCRNGKINYPEELMLVKGMTPALVYGDREHEGIINYITVAGDDGKINLNTAPLPVLQALSPEMTEGLARDLIEYRNDKAHAEALAATDWYRRVNGFPITINVSRDILKVASEYFEIRVDALLPPYGRTGIGIVHRKENMEQALMSWKVE